MKKSAMVAEALSRIHGLLRQRAAVHVLHTSDVSRRDRELLVERGWLQEVIKGWYLLTRPDVNPGDSSGWYATFWEFLSVYLHHYYGEEYCLSAEASLDLHLGVTVIPPQVIVMAPKGRGAPLDLPFGTSLLVYATEAPLPKERETVQGVQVMSLPYALCKVSPTFFHQQPREAEVALHAVRSSDDLLRVVVAHHFVRAAGRLVGAYRFLGHHQMAEALFHGAVAAGIKVQESNPFVEPAPFLPDRPIRSPHAARIIAMWREFRSSVIEIFPPPPGLPRSPDGYLQSVGEHYLQDAYHSLSIEGYRVSEELIDRVRQAQWNPEAHEEDRKLRDALAARGYYEAFQAAKSSLAKILSGARPGEVIEADLSTWYRNLFSPCVAAGIIEAGELYGYRRHQVYIRNSRHTPPPSNALQESMDSFFQFLREEDHPAVRAVLGHFLFVFIHPYMDGNGRIGRFVMNVMLGSGGYPWTIVHVERRKEYLDALEAASSGGDIHPFAHFLRSELEASSLTSDHSY